MFDILFHFHGICDWVDHGLPEMMENIRLFNKLFQLHKPGPLEAIKIGGTKALVVSFLNVTDSLYSYETLIMVRSHILKQNADFQEGILQA